MGLFDMFKKKKAEQAAAESDGQEKYFKEGEAPKKKAEEAKKPEPKATPAPAKKAEPIKKEEPKAAPAPAKKAEPVKKEEPKAAPAPAKKAEPAKKEEPKAAPAPAKKAEPAKKEELKAAPAPAKKPAAVKKVEEKPVKEEIPEDEDVSENDEVAVTDTKPTRNGKFDIRKSKDGRFYFNLYASNKQVIAYSQMYASTTSAINGIKSVIAHAPKAAIEDTTLKTPNPQNFPKWEIYIDKAGEYRFRLYASNGSCICHSHGYASKATCKGGMESIQRFASESADIDKSYLNK